MVKMKTSDFKLFLLKHQTFFSFIVLNSVFIFLYLYKLELFPLIWIDEGYFSNPAYDLINNGLFRTYIYDGYLNLEDFTFWQPPFYLLLLALSFKIFGISLLSGRIVSVILAIIGINIFYCIAKRFLKKNSALIITTLMGTFSYYFISARQIRMDIAVSTFTLVSFFFLFFKYYDSDSSERKKISYLIFSGIFSALAILSHPNGLLSVLLNIICIFLYNIPLKSKFILSTKLVYQIKEKFKPVLVYCATIFFICFPYLIIILFNLEIFQTQFSRQIGTSITDIWSNLITEPERYIVILRAYANNPLFSSFPDLMKYFIIFFLIFIFAIGFLILIFLTIKNDNKNAKILLIYTIGILIFFAFIISNKTRQYLCIMSPYLFLLVVYSFSYRRLIFLKLDRFKYKSIQIIKKYIDQKLLPIYKFIWLIIILLIHVSNLFSFYLVNEDYNPYYIHTVLENHSISNQDLIIANPTFFIPLYDYNIVHYNVFYMRNKSGESLDALLLEYNPKYFLYDARWRDYSGTGFDIEFLNYWEFFFTNNCTLLELFNSTVSSLDPLYLYGLNS